MKKIPHKWLTAAGAAILSGALLTGIAFAAPGASAGEAVQTAPGPASKLSPAELEVAKQLHSLRKKYIEQYKAESKAIIDKAVSEGKITQEAAEKLQRYGRFKHHKRKDREGGTH